MKRFHWVLLAILAVLAQPLAAHAQIITGSISGTVLDPSGGRIPDATVTLVKLTDPRKLIVSTSATGDFVFSGLDGGEYNITIAKTGFKSLEQKSVVLITGQRLSLGTLTLAVGGLTDVVSVMAERAQVQTQSSERAGTITGDQLNNLLVNSRSVPAMAQLLPGVVMALDSEYLTRQTRFNAVGNRTDTNAVMVDGVLSTDIDDGGNLKLQVSQDAVSEVTILLTNYQAEYGRMGGAMVQTVTKSGTRDFHGLGSYFMRREWLNANSFFNNRTGIANPRYRYNTITYNIGGPVLLPGGFNRNRDKLFFFFNQEYWPTKNPMTGTMTVPTELERAGDFSSSVDLSNRMIVVKDPFNGGVQFSGNKIPSNRIDPNGQALLNIFPKPNFFDRSISGGNYNYTWSAVQDNPNRLETVKIDYYVNANNILYGSYNGFRELEKGAAGGYWLGNWQQMPVQFLAPNKGASLRYTRVISPNMVNEAHFGWFANPETAGGLTDADWQNNLRKNRGFNIGMLNAKANLDGVLPQATFGGVTGAGFLKILGRLPVNSPYNLYTWNDKLTYVRGKHIFKAGLTVERFFRDIEPESNQFGSFSFANNANNPLNTGYAYANAVLGVFDTYTEDSEKSWQRSRGGTVDFFIQDTWKVTPKLTLDYGMRFYYFVPTFTKDGKIAAFVPERFSSSKQVRLIRPGFNAQGKRAGVDPVTGNVYPVGLIGAIVPGVGDPANGMVVAAQNPDYPQALWKNRGLQYGPRFGFAYDPFGKNKTAIRGGFGIFYNPLTTNKWRTLSTQPPLIWQPYVYYGQLSTLTTSQSLYFPPSVRNVDVEGYVPTIMNFSLGIQQNVGFGTVVDISYVGSLGRHLAWVRDLNYIPLGARFKAENADPTLPGSALNDALLRPLAGYNNIDRTEMAGTSSYHSLQVTANRRFAKGVQFGVSWTWSKVMDYNDADTTSISPVIPIRVWNYGMAGFDRTHVVKINWQWNLPKSPWANRVAQAILSNWQLSGITTFQSGSPLGVSFSTTTGMDITGTPSQGARVDVVGDLVLPKGDRTFEKNFRTENVRLPAKGTVGNSARTLLRGPGINNFDAALFKNVPVWESLKLQLRWEAYNMFNHTQFSAINTAARFDPAGNQINTQLGQFTAARSPRRMQLAVRLYF